MNFRFTCTALLSLACIVFLSACSTKSDSLDTVRVNEVTHSIFYAPQYAAIELGFFKEEGIQVELTNGGGADKVMSAVISDHADIGLAGPEANIYVYEEGKKDHTQIFAQLTNRDGSMLVGRTQDPNFSWDSLKGKHILPGRKGGVPYMAFEYALRQNQLDPATDVLLDTSIQFDNMTGAFLSGTGDYVTVFEPAASNLASQGKAFIVAAVGDAVGEMPYTAYFAKKSFLENNQDLILRFTRAVAKGEDWVSKHSAKEIAEVVSPHFPDIDLSLLEQAVANYQDVGAYSTTPVLAKEGLEKLQTVMMEAGELEQAVPFEAIVDNSFAETAVKALF